MKRLVLVLLLFMASTASIAHAEWRWSRPNLAKQTVTFHCNTTVCIKSAYKTALKRYQRRVHRYDQQRLKEWKRWTRLYIPTCTWYGESGIGHQFAPYRYSVPNSGGSGAYGKYQMMSGTYHSRAKYDDWSPLDQEIAGHREFFVDGTSPWSNC